MKFFLPFIVVFNTFFIAGLLLPHHTKAQDLCTAGTQRGSFTVVPEAGCAPLTVTVVNTKAGATNLTWDYNYRGQLTPVYTQSVTHTYAQAGTYTILQAGSAGGLGFTLCKQVKVVDTTPPNVQIATLPVGKVRLTLASDSITRQYDRVEINWSDGSPVAVLTKGQAQEVEHIYAGTGQRLIRVRGLYSSGGCGGSTTAEHVVSLVSCDLTAFVTVNGQREFCEGQSTQLMANPGTGYTYQWFRNGTLLPNATAVDLTATVSGNYAVRVTDSTGCVKTSEVQNISVNPLPVLTLVSPTERTICSSRNLEFKVQGTSPISRFEWLRNGQLIPNAGGSSLVISESGTYEVRAFSSAGCSKTSDKVVINPPYQVDLVAQGSTIFCQAENVKLSTRSTSSSLSGYQWYRDGTAIAGATTDTYVASVSGAYAVETTEASGCKVRSETQQVEAKARPVKPVITGTVELIMYSSAAEGNQWYRNGAVIAGATAASYAPAESGFYTVQVTQEGCSSVMSNAFEYIITANEPALAASVLLYPNPASERLYVSLQELTGRVQVELFSPDGRMVREQQVLSASQQRVVPLELKGLAPGTYVVRVRTGTFTKTSKVIVR